MGTLSDEKVDCEPEELTSELEAMLGLELDVEVLELLVVDELVPDVRVPVVLVPDVVVIELCPLLELVRAARTATS